MVVALLPLSERTIRQMTPENIESLNLESESESG